MTRQALSPPDSKIRDDEATGTRPKISAELPSLSPLTFGRQLFDVGRARDALEIFERELETGNESAELQFWAGRAAFSLGDYVHAQRALSRAVSLSPTDAETQRWLARVLLRQGNILGAARVMGRVSQGSQPSQPVLELRTSVTLLREVDLDAAEGEDPPTTQWMLSSGRRPKSDPAPK